MDLSWTEFGAIAFAVVAVGALFASFKHKEKEVAIAIHKWTARFATALSNAGASKTVVRPFQDLAAGDDESAFGHGETAVEYLEQPANWETELLNMVRKGNADPIIGPKLRQFFKDLLDGASDATLRADADDVMQASPLNDIGQANAELKDTVEHIYHETHHPELANAFNLLPKGQKHLGKLLIAGKAKASAVIPEPAFTAPPVFAPIPDGHILLGPNATLPASTSAPAPSSSSPPKPNADGTPAS